VTSVLAIDIGTSAVRAAILDPRGTVISATRIERDDETSGVWFNPDVLWDGKNQWTKQECPDGVYFYTCDVQEYTLQGIRTRHLNGSVTILRNRSNTQKY
jgi:glycerol kinase